MLFAIHALDRPNDLKRRLDNYDAHKAFLPHAAEFGVKLVMSGPLVADDGSTMIGSLMVVEAPDRAAVERFNGSDPFAKAGVWEKVTINGFIKRQG
jgi:uncharacterized protein